MEHVWGQIENIYFQVFVNDKYNYHYINSTSIIQNVLLAAHPYSKNKSGHTWSVSYQTESMDHIFCFCDNLDMFITLFDSTETI